MKQRFSAGVIFILKGGALKLSILLNQTTIVQSMIKNELVVDA